MIDRFKGWSKVKIAITASIECQVGHHTCYEVLFKGKAIRSPATQRVALWAKREGYRILRPANGGGSGEGGISSGVPDVTTSIEEAERKVAELEAAKGR